MKRVEFLKINMCKETDVEVLTKAIVAKDEKFLRRHIRDLKDQVEDLEEDLEKRLSSDVPLDKSTLELYRRIINLEEEIAVADSFEIIYL